MINIVSYGGGTQSTAMTLMALNGDYGLPRPDFGVYADTGGEPAFINEYVRYFIKLVKDTAVDFEKTVQARQNDYNSVQVFLHRSCKPLDQVMFTDENQLNMFPELIDECAGECGI